MFNKKHNAERVIRVINDKSVNEFDFTITPKDIRTWGANVYALLYHDELLKKKGNSSVNSIVRNVSRKLSNTPRVAKEYYIHPEILSFLKKNKYRPFIAVKSERNIRNYEVLLGKILNDSKISP